MSRPETWDRGWSPENRTSSGWQTAEPDTRPAIDPIDSFIHNSNDILAVCGLDAADEWSNRWGHRLILICCRSLLGSNPSDGHLPLNWANDPLFYSIIVTVSVLVSAPPNFIGSLSWGGGWVWRRGKSVSQDDQVDWMWTTFKDRLIRPANVSCPDPLMM